MEFLKGNMQAELFYPSQNTQMKWQPTEIWQ